MPSVSRRHWSADLAELTRRTLHHWKGNVTGSIGAAIFALLTTLSLVLNAAAALTPKPAAGEPTPWVIAWSNPHLSLALGIAFTVWIFASISIGIVQAWGDKHHEGIATKHTLKDTEHALTGKRNEVNEKNSQIVSLRNELDQERLRNTPSLVAEHAAHTLFGTGGPQGVMLVMTVTIRNVPPGAPSAAYNFGLRVSKDGKQYAYRFQKIPSEFPIRGPLDGGGVWNDVVRGQDSLIERTTDPIPVGGLKTGWLIAFLTDFKDRKSLDGAHLAIEFFDVCKKRYTLEFDADMGSLGYTVFADAGVSWSYKEDRRPVGVSPPQGDGRRQLLPGEIRLQ